MPFVVNLVVVALIWKVMPIDKVGFINRMFELVGLQGRSVDILAKPLAK